MAVTKFVPKQYNLSNTMGLLTSSLMPVTSTTGDEVYAINVYNQTTNQNSARIANEANLNAMIDEVGDTFEYKFSKNTAFNKNFGALAGDVCQGNDDRLSNSRRCDNTFDDSEVAKTNLGLHTVATTGNYNQLENKPYIPDNYDYFPGILMSAVAGFSNLGHLTSSSSAMTKTLNYKKKYCFIGYGGYTASYMYSISGGTWQGASLDFASDFVVIPTYSGSMAGSQKVFEFITSDGIYHYRANNTSEITISLNRPDCYAYSEATMYTYY